MRLLIVGAGGHGRSIAELAWSFEHLELIGFVDDAANGQVFGDAGVLGRIDALASLVDLADAAIVAIGNNGLRETLCAQVEAVGLRLISLVHPRAIVSPSAVVGAGSAIMAGAIVGTQAVLGRGVIVNSGSVVDHHCLVEDFGHVGAGAVMAGGSILGRSAWMQAGCALGYGVRVAGGEVLSPGESRGRSP